MRLPLGLLAGLLAGSLLHGGPLAAPVREQPLPPAVIGARLYAPGTGYVYTVLAHLPDAAALCRRDDGLILAVGGDWLQPLWPLATLPTGERP